MTPQMEFAERCAAVAAELALAFAGQPDEKVARSLEQMAANLRTEACDERSLIGCAEGGLLYERPSFRPNESRPG